MSGHSSFSLGSAPGGVGTQVRSVTRALNLIELLATAGRPLALSELRARADLPPSTAHHLLGTLVARGYAHHDAKSRAYSMGRRLAELTQPPGGAQNLASVAMPLLKELNAACGEAVHLARMQGFSLDTLARLESSQAVRVDTSALAKSDAAHATATGKALLAHWPAPQLQAYLQHAPLRRFTPHTLTDPAALATQLLRVQRRGYAEDDEEFHLGVWCVGAPVRDASGQVVAAVSCSMPVMRASRQEATRLRQLVCACTQDISQRLALASAAACPA